MARTVKSGPFFLALHLRYSRKRFRSCRPVLSHGAGSIRLKAWPESGGGLTPAALFRQELGGIRGSDRSAVIPTPTSSWLGPSEEDEAGRRSDCEQRSVLPTATAPLALYRSLD